MSKIIEHNIPPQAPPPKPIDGINWAVEWRLWLEIGRLALAAPGRARLPKGSSTVFLIPGWMAPEISMEPLRLFLKSLGYEARHWGLGTNAGDPMRHRERMVEIVSRAAVQQGRSVALVGWSLGGVIARETARRVPKSVSGIVTYGTPVIGGPTYTIAAKAWGPAQCQQISSRLQELDSTFPIQVPIAAIFARTDEIVSWPACIDRISPKVTHLEVHSPHIAMGFDPAVWGTIARQLHRFNCQS